MVFSAVMAKGFNFKILQDWTDAEIAKGSPFIAGLEAHQKLLLFSEGSMTLELELLTGSKVEAELNWSGTVPLSSGDSVYLEDAEGSEAVEREVWLTSAGKKLLYANTVIPAEKLDKDLRGALEVNSSEPLGRVLSSSGVLFAKKRLQVALVRSLPAARDLAIPAESLFYARRYILFSKNAERWLIKAAVTEIFSPRLMGAGIRS